MDDNFKQLDRCTHCNRTWSTIIDDPAEKSGKRRVCPQYIPVTHVSDICFLCTHCFTHLEIGEIAAYALSSQKGLTKTRTSGPLAFRITSGHPTEAYASFVGWTMHLLGQAPNPPFRRMAIVD